MNAKVRLLIVVAVMLGVSAVLGADVRAQSSHEIYCDDFNSAQLDPKWTFVNPATNPEGQSWSLTENPGFLTMTTTGPTDLIGDNNTAPRMFQVAPEGDYVIEVRVLADPDVAFEHAGILVMTTPTSWVRLIRDYLYQSVYLQTGPSAIGWHVPTTASDVILRLTKVGSTYDGSFSTDGGETFEWVGEVDGPEEATNIGTTVVSTPAGNVFTAQFDYFRVGGLNLESGVAAEDLPDNQVRIRACANGELSELMLQLHIYGSEENCITDSPESSETLDHQVWDPALYRFYDESFVRTIPAGKWYKSELTVSSNTDDTNENSTPCATGESPPVYTSLPATSTVGIVVLVLLLGVAGIVLLKRTRLAIVK